MDGDRAAAEPRGNAGPGRWVRALVKVARFGGACRRDPCCPRGQAPRRLAPAPQFHVRERLAFGRADGYPWAIQTAGSGAAAMISLSCRGTSGHHAWPSNGHVDNVNDAGMRVQDSLPSNSHSGLHGPEISGNDPGPALPYGQRTGPGSVRWPVARRWGGPATALSFFSRFAR